MTTTPPRPWSLRMRNAARVLQAYLDVETRLHADAEAAQKMGLVNAETAILRRIEAAQLQTTAARAQMWIIHQEEQNK